MDIKTVIKDKGFTMDSLAKKMNRSKSSISQVANGNPTIDKIKDIANGLGCHWLEFFADELQKEGIEVKRADGTNLLSSNPRPVGAGIFRCPNCGCGVVMEIKMVQPPTASSEQSSDELPFKDEA
jgi:transcriptional regulator with XRE-family HTH domain